MDSNWNDGCENVQDGLDGKFYLIGSRKAKIRISLFLVGAQPWNLDVPIVFLLQMKNNDIYISP